MKFKAITIIVAESPNGRLSILKKNGRIISVDGSTLAIKIEDALAFEWSAWIVKNAAKHALIARQKVKNKWDRKIEVWVTCCWLREKYGNVKGTAKTPRLPSSTWDDRIKRMYDAHHNALSRSKMDRWGTWALTTSNNSSKRAKVKHDTIERRKGQCRSVEEAA